MAAVLNRVVQAVVRLVLTLAVVVAAWLVIATLVDLGGGTWGGVDEDRLQQREYMP